MVDNTSLTSFDPSSIIPLLPHPKHLHIIPKDPEPLYTPIKFGKFTNFSSTANAVIRIINAKSTLELSFLSYIDISINAYSNL